MVKPTEPSRAMLAAIGHVAAEASRVEDKLRRLYCYLIDSMYGAVITAGEDLDSLCNSALRVSRYNLEFSEENAAGLLQIVKEVQVVRPLRNFLIHAQWERLGGRDRHFGLRSSRASPRAGRSQGIHDEHVWTPEDAESVAGAFRRIGRRIDAYIEQTFPSRPGYPVPIERTTWSGAFAHLQGRGQNDVDEPDPMPPRGRVEGVD